MKSGFNRLHELRMANDAKGYEMDDLRPRFDSLRGRKENGKAPAIVTAFNLFQTPPGLAARMAALFTPTPGKRWLEPSAGLGRLLDAVAHLKPSAVVAVEQASSCAEQLYKRQDISNLYQRDFLTMTAAQIGRFDRVIMNPPFHMRADIRHIEHALGFLQRGGELVGICMAGTARDAALREQCAEWVELPEGVFEGTKVATIMFKIIKP